MYSLLKYTAILFIIFGLIGCGGDSIPDSVEKNDGNYSQSSDETAVHQEDTNNTSSFISIKNYTIDSDTPQIMKLGNEKKQHIKVNVKGEPREIYILLTNTQIAGSSNIKINDNGKVTKSPNKIISNESSQRDFSNAIKKVALEIQKFNSRQIKPLSKKRIRKNINSEAISERTRFSKNRKNIGASEVFYFDPYRIDHIFYGFPGCSTLHLPHLFL